MRSRRSAPGCTLALLAFGLLLLLVWSPLSGEDSTSEPAAPLPPPSVSLAPESPDPDVSATRAESPAPADRPRSETIDSAKAALPGLAVKGRAPLTDYDREAFGAPWSDVNDNGCDTRNDILRRDLTDKVVEDCVVMSGVLEDPYSGGRIAFQRGPVSSLEVQIDHVVSLSNAWQTGAKYWTDRKRERFANDRRNLLAVRGDLNMSKGDGDAATWLPPKKSFRCTYVALQVLTKARYDLWVTPAEQQAMARILEDC